MINMEPMWIVAAFVFGTIASRAGLPPMVGYLLAGFALNKIGIQGGELLDMIAGAGVTLLLFTIGLKLKVKNLTRPVVWAGATAHMSVTVAFIGAGLGVLGLAGLPGLNLPNWRAAILVAFALSFSSTVFAVKVLEGRKEMASRHAETAIGILIMQDIAAVVFLAASRGKIPSPWALALAASLLALRPLMGRFMTRCGHGELLMLFGVVMAAVGYSGFEWVALKGDLGALVFGMLLADHPKAPELAERLLGFKDLFLVGFFLTVGISGSPTPAVFGVALLLVLAVPLKAILFFGILLRFRLRARTSMLASFSLANYSEFGLIVASVGVANGWIGSDWLTISALALSLSFVVAAPLNSSAHAIYARFSDSLRRYESRRRLPEDESIDTGSAEILIVGMGGVGTAAFDEMKRRRGEVVLGMDFCDDTVKRHQALGRQVIFGDAGDSDFWGRIDLAAGRFELVMLALPDPAAGAFALRQLRAAGYQGRVAASVRYEDQIPTLKQEGIDAAYSLYQEAGVGFANHACVTMEHCRLQETPLTS